jgi:hypothetical protein
MYVTAESSAKPVGVAVKETESPVTGVAGVGAEIVTLGAAAARVIALPPVTAGQASKRVSWIGWKAWPSVLL